MDHDERTLAASEPLDDLELEEIIAEAEEGLDSGFVQFGAAKVYSLAVEVSASREAPGFDRFVAISERFLTNYPADVFTGESGDPGARFVVKLRAALAELAEVR